MEAKWPRISGAAARQPGLLGRNCRVLRCSTRFGGEPRPLTSRHEGLWRRHQLVPTLESARVQHPGRELDADELEDLQKTLLELELCNEVGGACSSSR